MLRKEFPSQGKVLEVASGSGEHALYFASRFPQLIWQPSDCEQAALVSIESWRRHAGCPENLKAPIWLDASESDWELTGLAAILCINMVHISPAEATQGLMKEAGRLLPDNGPLVLYGPYREPDVPTAPSNEAFDRDLRMRDPRWGLRSIEWMDKLAHRNRLHRTRRVAMPANNLTLVYRRSA